MKKKIQKTKQNLAYCWVQLAYAQRDQNLIRPRSHRPGWWTNSRGRHLSNRISKQRGQTSIESTHGASRSKGVEEGHGRGGEQSWWWRPSGRRETTHVRATAAAHQGTSSRGAAAHHGLGNPIAGKRSSFW